MRKALLGAVSALAIGASAAQAQDFGNPHFDWSGFYGGGNAGLAILDGSVRITDFAIGGSNTFGLDDTGFTGGGQLGWNFYVDQFLLGVEGDFNFLDLDDRSTLGTAKGPIAARTDYDWFATIRGRAGMPMDAFLFYVTGGVAFMDSRLRVTDQFATTASTSDVLVGWTIGGGFEFAFNESWSAKAEYLYADFESQSVGTAFAHARSRPDLHILRLGVNYHFCTGGPC